jgi:hypothetical protein
VTSDRTRDELKGEWRRLFSSFKLRDVTDTNHNKKGAYGKHGSYKENEEY